MKRRNLVVAVMILAVVAAALPLAATRKGAMRSKIGPAQGLFALRTVAESINLTDEQVIELRYIAKDVRQENANSRAVMRKNFLDAAQLLLDNPGDIEGARGILKGNEAVVDERRSNVLEGISESLTVLTPEQRSQLSKRLDTISQLAEDDGLF